MNPDSANEWERQYETSVEVAKSDRRARRAQLEAEREDAAWRRLERPAQWVRDRITLGRRSRIAVQILLCVWSISLWIFRPALGILIFSALMIIGLGLMVVAQAFPPLDSDAGTDALGGRVDR
jgi:hypothetical protein